MALSEMKNDQVVRSIGVVAVVALYGVFLTMNGSGVIRDGTLGIGPVHPFVATLATILLLALPELIHSLPFGPNRGQK